MGKGSQEFPTTEGHYKSLSSTKSAIFAFSLCRAVYQTCFVCTSLLDLLSYCPYIEPKALNILRNVYVLLLSDVHFLKTEYFGKRMKIDLDSALPTLKSLLGKYFKFSEFHYSHFQ